MIHTERLQRDHKGDTIQFLANFNEKSCQTWIKYKHETLPCIYYVSETESGDDVEIDIKEGTEADGLHQYHQALPFRSTALQKLLEILKSLKDRNQALTVDALEIQLSNDEDWVHAFEDVTDIYFKRFLESNLFIPDNTSEESSIDEDKLVLFAIFSCKDVD